MTRSKGPRRLIVTAAVAVVLITLPSTLWGPVGGLGGFLAALPVVAWRHDNDVGLFFPLAVMTVIVVLVMLLLLILLMIKVN